MAALTPPNNTATAATKPLSKSHHLANHLTDKTNMATLLSRRYEQLLISEKHHDCSFHIAGTRIKCHKLILSSASPVFEAMFYGPLRAAAVEREPEEIEILDISPELFRVLMRYIYAGDVNFDQLTLEQTVELYYGAEKYLLSELIGVCLLAIRRKLRFANILPALELSVCLDFGELLDVCLTFFTRCCLSDPQYMAHLKTHYQHVSKECIKTVIAATNKDAHLLWFVYEWCQHECAELGLPQDNCALIIDNLQLKLQNGDSGASSFNGNDLLRSSAKIHARHCCAIERSYYKATRPFTVDFDGHEWKLIVQCDRFVSLHGIIMYSRLAPNLSASGVSHASVFGGGFPSEYCESLSIEIRGKRQTQKPIQNDNSDGEDEEATESDHEADAARAERHQQQQQVEEADEADSVIWRHSILKQPTKYNCDLVLRWDEGVILSPDCAYEVKLIWQSNAFGAEYPCSLLSNLVDGIQFRDYNAQGSLIKGLRFVNMV